MTAKHEQLGNRGEKVKHSPHLSAEQMEAMLRRSAFRLQAAKHLDVCEDCREEVESLSALLNRFRSTSVLYAEREQMRCGLDQPRQPEHRFEVATSVRWPVACGLLGCILAAAAVVVHPFAPASGRSGNETASGQSLVQTREVSDEALLTDVQNDLSASVPAPLQLLAATATAVPPSHGKPIQASASTRLRH